MDSCSQCVYKKSVSPCVCVFVCVPVCDSLLQLSQQVLVELVKLGQVVEDLIQHPLFHHRLPTGTGRFGYRIPEVLLMETEYFTDKVLYCTTSINSPTQCKNTKTKQKSFKKKTKKHPKSLIQIKSVKLKLEK